MDNTAKLVGIFGILLIVILLLAFGPSIITIFGIFFVVIGILLIDKLGNRGK